MNIILLEDNISEAGTLVLSDISQVNHIKNVLKLNIGDSLRIGIKNRKLGIATIEKITSDLVLLSNINLSHNPPSKLNLTVILALPRPKVLRRLLIDMTAIGVNEIVLLNSYRSNKSYWQSPMLNRIDEFIVEGLQQAVDTVPPVVTMQHRFKPYVEDKLSELIQSHPDNKAIVAHPYADYSIKEYMKNKGLPNILCVGGEGGWIDYEVDLLQSVGCQSVHFGPRILRTEAAVNALCGLFL